MHEIRRLHGVGARTLYEWLAEEGLARRPRGPRCKPRGTRAEPVHTYRVSFSFVRTETVSARSLEDAVATLRRKVGGQIDIVAVARV